MAQENKKQTKKLICSKVGHNAVLVYCRVRPSKGEECKEEPLIELEGKVVNVSKNNKSYEFDGTLNVNSTQKETFDMIAKPCVHHCLNGYRSALMAYGQTGTGKSHTMCCMKAGEEGIIPRAAQMLFEEIKTNTDKTWNVHMQFLQIYRDNLADLMTESGKDRVDIYFDKETGVTLPGCSVHEAKTVDEFMHIYNVGNARRVITATAMNPESSRSHTALVVWVSAISHDMAETETRGKITFIDLAGYERFSKTGISADNPVMRDEAKTINASLLSLGHVVSSLSHGDSHIPWRNSKLTRILQDSIGGRSRTTIILTVGPSHGHVFETTNTLQFGLRAMAVKVQAKATETVNYQHLSLKLQNILNEKEERINALELQAASHEVDKEELQAHHQRDLEQLRISHTKEIEEITNGGASDEKVMHLLKQQQIERDNLIEQQREEIIYTVEKHVEDNKDILGKLDDEHEKQLAGLRLQIRDLELELNEKNNEILLFKSQIKDDIDTAINLTDVTPPNSAKSSASPPSSRSAPPIVTKLSLSKLKGDNTPRSSFMKDIGDLSYEDLSSIINDLENRSEKDRQLTINLQVELDRTKKLCQERSEDLLEMESYVKDLQAKYAAENNGDDCPLTDEKLNGITFAELIQKKPSKVSTVKMVDAKLLDQAIKKHREEMRDNEEQIETLKKTIIALEMQQISGVMGADDNKPLITPRGFFPMTSRVTPRGMLSSRVPSDNSSGVPLQTIRNSLQRPGSVLTHDLRMQIDFLLRQLKDSHQEIRDLRVTRNDKCTSKLDVGQPDFIDVLKVRKEREGITELRSLLKPTEKIQTALETVTADIHSGMDACYNANRLSARVVRGEKKTVEEELKINQLKNLLKELCHDDVTLTVECAKNANRNVQSLKNEQLDKNIEGGKLQVATNVMRIVLYALCIKHIIF